MLLSGEGRVVGAVTTSPLSFVVLDSSGTAGVVGRPSATAIRTAADQAREILSVPDDAWWTALALPEWRSEEATLFVRGEGVGFPPFSASEARLVTPGELAEAPVPEAMRQELAAEAGGGEMAAAFEGGRPVAFCYPASVTEGWWDISIDTLEPFRRRGHAGRAVACCARHMARTGRRPVWGAVASNVASARLAEKLGFAPVDRLIVFSRED
jgi:RimJ/RimL family protein N-acetyltransferase